MLFQHTTGMLSTRTWCPSLLPVSTFRLNGRNGMCGFFYYDIIFNTIYCAMPTFSVTTTTKIWKGNSSNVWLSGRYQQPVFGKNSSVQMITCITGRGIQWRSSDIQVLTCCSSPFLSLSSQTHTLVWLISSAFTANAFRGTKWHRPRPHAANGDAHAAHTWEDAALTGNGFVWGRFLPNRVPVVRVDRDG